MSNGEDPIMDGIDGKRISMKFNTGRVMKGGKGKTACGNQLKNILKLKEIEKKFSKVEKCEKYFVIQPMSSKNLEKKLETKI